jgi:undecaprenyl diphosphate synthase
MDGNGRWAKSRGAERIYGHQHAVEAVSQVTEGCAELGVKYLTLYAFSTENWARPKSEVDGLMKLLVSTIRKELKNLNKNNIKLMTIGQIESLPKTCQRELIEAITATSGNTGLTVILALSYSGRWEILEAAKKISRDVSKGRLGLEDIDAHIFEGYLETNFVPDPELLIRTSGEMRISNFLLWQLAYTEIYFTKKMWPDFRKEDLLEAIREYQNRERRFGKISEQVKP